MRWISEAWADLEATHYGAPVARLQAKGDKAASLLLEIKRARASKHVPDPMAMQVIALK